MPTNIVEVDQYDANISVPINGDARDAASVQTPFQSLTNRTLNLKNRVESLESRYGAIYTVSGAGVTFGSRFTLTLDKASEAGFTLSSNEVEVPAAGYYLLLLHLAATHTDVTDPTHVIAAIRKTGPVTLVETRHTRTSATANDAVNLSTSVLIEIATPASEKIELVSLGNNLNVAGSGAHLSVLRVL